jgi:uncharacterized protein (DUF58 family)
MPAVSRLTRLFGRGSVAKDDDLLDPTFFSRLDRLRLKFARGYGVRSGETPVRGLIQDFGIEIESFKSYAPGDDIRYLDWNAVGRLDQLLTRRFVAEREIPVHVLVDASRSMGVPSADRKLGFAVALAASLAYVALNSNDPVRVAALRLGAADVEVDESPFVRHRGRFARLRPFLAGLTASGGTALEEGITRYVERHRERGVAFVLSDFLVPPESYGRALERLRARGLETQVIQIVGREERGLGSLYGRLRLRDSESGAIREVLLTAADRRRYAEAFSERIDAIRGYCHRNGFGHALASAADGVEHCLKTVLPQAGMIRLR